MSLWQYNAWCEAHQDRIYDQLSLEVQAAYLGAYWGAWTKTPKKSLASVLKSLRPKREAKRKPIDADKVREDFRKAEELRKNGWYQE